MKPIIKHKLFFILLIIVTLAFLGVIQDFLLSSFWAAVLAIIFYPLYLSLHNHLPWKNNGLAAALTTLLILFMVVVPATILVVALINESLNMYQRLNSGQIDLGIILNEINERLPLADSILDRVGLSMEKLKEGLGNAGIKLTQELGNRTIDFTQNAISLMVQFTIMLYLLFFFFLDGRKIVEKTMDALPLGNDREEILFQRFVSVSRATLKGSLIVAIVQGTLGGILFKIVGIEGALFWGAIMILTSLLPAIGSAIVWAPAAAILLIQGQYWQGITIILVGALVISLVDNILRPILVGRDTEMPDYLVLLTTVGGISLLGLSGFVIGPVIAALFLTCWEIMGEEYGGKER